MPGPVMTLAQVDELVANLGKSVWGPKSTVLSVWTKAKVATVGARKQMIFPKVSLLAKEQPVLPPMATEAERKMSEVVVYTGAGVKVNMALSRAVEALVMSNSGRFTQAREPCTTCKKRGNLHCFKDDHAKGSACILCMIFKKPCSERELTEQEEARRDAILLQGHLASTEKAREASERLVKTLDNM